MVDQVAVGARSARADGRRSRRWLRVLLPAIAGVTVVVVLGGRVPDPAAVVAVVGGADLRWAALAVLAQVLSQAMFALQQHRLLSAFAVDMSPLRALAITYSRSAISMAMPAGSAVSAAFAFQRYRERGASRSIAAAVVVLSTVASTAGLVLLYATGLLTAAATSLARLWTPRAIIPVGAAVLVVTAGALTARSFLRRTGTARTASPCRAAHDTESRWPAARRAREHLAGAVRQARAVPVRDRAAAIGFSVANWLLDLVCLAAVAHACHLTLGYAELAGSYLAGQVARQLPITPGGVGLVETSLLAGFVVAGASQPSAAAVVLGYRLISFWLVLPVGLATYLGLRQRSR